MLFDSHIDVLKVAFSVIRQWSLPLVVFTKPWGPVGKRQGRSGAESLVRKSVARRLLLYWAQAPSRPAPPLLTACIAQWAGGESALLRRRVSFQAAFVLFSEVFSGPLRSCDIHPCVMRVGKLIFVNMIPFKKYREGISDLMLWLSPYSLLKCLITDPESSPLA